MSEKRELLRVFNIERFATEDGPGIRTVVFLKGCSLRCRWCANPESQSFRPEILVKVNACGGCGRCASVCSEGAVRALSGSGYVSDPDRCIRCGSCAENCFSDARELLGKDYTPEELVKILLRDEEYYLAGGGGVTFSGGEPCWYSGVIAETAAMLKARGINILVETCGQVPEENLREVSSCAEAIYYDIKHVDSLRHRELTGAGNELILENLRWLCGNYSGDLSVRYPYIPGCNDGEEDIQEFFRLLRELKLEKAVFLPYHRLGTDKYKGLGRKYEMGEMESLKKADLAFLVEAGAAVGIRVTIE
ncbi:MAG: glycyl-radical enzyme activating protein [Clostridia bacterium]|nr:glycyl-radical enzyme activating protein [Clostridia bacterium]